MVSTRLSEGVLFSKRVYVPLEHAEDTLKFYLDSRNLENTLKQKPLKFIGIV